MNQAMEEYWRNRLGSKQQAAYDAFKSALNAGRTQAQLPELSQNEVQAVTVAMELDHPEFYFLGGQYRLTLTSTSGGFFRAFAASKTLTLEIDPLYTPSQIGKINVALSAVTSEVRRAASGGKEAEKAVAEHLVRNATYAIDTTWNQNAAAALYFRRAQCSGIAKAFKYLMDRLGKWCIVVTGTARGNDGRTEAHAWNVIEKNGRYYHVDPTFMLGANPNARSSASINYLYFNWSDGAMRKTHQWDARTVPQCTDTRFDADVERMGYRPLSAPPRTGSSGGQITEVRSAQELYALLGKSGKTVRFRLKLAGSLESQQNAVMDTVRKYCLDKRMSAGIQVSCYGDVWTVEIT